MIFDKCTFSDEKVSEMEFYVSQLKEEEMHFLSTSHDIDVVETNEADIGQSCRPFAAGAYECSFGIGLTD